MLAIGVERNLEISIGGVEGTEELGTAGYFRDSIARRSRRISGSMDMLVELRVVHAYADGIIRLPGHYLGCRPLRWFRDRFNDAFFLQFVQLLLHF
jgi:hypothetical protein